MVAYPAGKRPYNRQCNSRERDVQAGGKAAKREPRAAPAQLFPSVLDHCFQYLCW